jgi:hypothetical protein
MNYRDILGLSDKQPKKKVVKKHKPSVTEGLKKQFGDTINEGPAYEYSKFIKQIEKSKDSFGKDVLNFYELLRKKGLDDEAYALLDNYKNNVIKFGKEFKQFVRKLV